MDIRFGFDWVLLIVFIAILIYTMRVIAREKDTAIKNGVMRTLGELSFLTPPWWDLTSNENDTLIFERTDTRYDWKGSFSKLSTPLKNDFDLREKFIEIIKSKNLLLDEIHAFAPLEKIHEEHRVLHIESTGTVSGIERVYYDAYLIYQEEQNQLYYFESLSSVLNGMVEGPYFEEASKNFKWTKVD